MRWTTKVGVIGRGAVGSVLMLTSAVGCTPSMIIGPLSHQQEERDHVFMRAKRAELSTDVLEKVFPPLTPEEKRLAEEQDSSCRGSYMWKGFLTYGGSGLVATAAGITIGGAYATGNTDTAKAIFGVTGGTLALFGTLLVAIGGMIQNSYTDRGCSTRVTAK